MDDSTEQAITDTIDQQFEALRASIFRYAREQEAVANGRPVALTRALQYLESDLVPELVERLITFCLDVEVQNADFITRKIRETLEPRLKTLAESLGATFQSSLPAGFVTREIQIFQSWVDAFCISLPGRVQPAVEKRSHMSWPAPVVSPGGHTIIYGGSGPLQVFQGSPGSSATIHEATPAASTAPRPEASTPTPPAPSPPPTATTQPTVPPAPEKKPRFTVQNLGALIGIPASIATVLGFMIVYGPMKRKPNDSPAVPPSVAPAGLIAPPPAVPTPIKANLPPAAPEQPKIHQPVKHAKKSVKEADDVAPKTATTTPPSLAPALPREDSKPAPKGLLTLDVRDLATGRPLEGVPCTTTDKREIYPGRQIELPFGRYPIDCALDGYFPGHVEADVNGNEAITPLNMEKLRGGIQLELVGDHEDMALSQVGLQMKYVDDKGNPIPNIPIDSSRIGELLARHWVKISASGCICTSVAENEKAVKVLGPAEPKTIKVVGGQITKVILTFPLLRKEISRVK